MSENYLSAAEAARRLGVTRQRVAKMAEDGDVIAIRPWPGAVRIPVSSVEAWARGERRPGITKTAAMDYLLSEAEGDIGSLSGERAALVLAQYIEGVRPEWTQDKRDAWVNDMVTTVTA